MPEFFFLLADSLAYQTEKTLNELGDKVPAEERQRIQEKVTALREALKGDDSDQIKRLSEDLQNAFHAISQQLYAQQQASEGHAPGSGTNGDGRDGGPEDEGEVVEGEFREA